MLSLLSFVITANAQIEIAFSPDCPGATTGPDIMPQWSIDWETGSSYEWNRRNGLHEHTWTINTSLFRLGLTTNVELRFQLDERPRWHLRSSMVAYPMHLSGQR